MNQHTSSDPEARSPTSSLPAVTRKMLSTLLSLSPDALLVVDHQGTILLANEQLAQLFAFSLADLIGHPLEILLPDRLRAVHLTHRASYAAAPRLRPMGKDLPLLGRRRDGSEFAVDISLRPVRLEQALATVAAVRDVSQQRLLKQAYAVLSEHLQLQVDLINLARDAILVRDPINRVLSWNRGAEELYGWSAQQALGRLTQTLLKTRAPQGQAVLEQHLEQEGRWEGELIHTRRDGTPVVVESRQVLVRDARGIPSAVLEINRDITARRRLEQAQSATHLATVAQQTFLQELLDALPLSICVVRGPQARLVLSNQAAAGLWGAVWLPEQPMQAFLAAQDIQIVDPRGRPYPPSALATMRALVQGEAVLQQEEALRLPTGKQVPILVNAVPLTTRHRPRLDAQESEAQPAEEPLALILHQDVRQLKEAEYLKDEFVGIAAHELRTPLAVLKATVGTLVRQTARGHGPELAPWQTELLHELDEATDRLSRLSDDLLEVTRLQAGHLSLQSTPTEVFALLRRVTTRLQASTSRHTLEVHVQGEPLVAQIDPKRSEQVLDNLLTNAIKYSPAGGPIQVTAARDAEGHQVLIQVRDQGIGIPAHQHGLIFGRFMRADNARAAGISGTGLGLYLCRALIEQQQGRLWFESVEGEGTTFFLTFPLVEASQESEAPGPLQAE